MGWTAQRRVGVVMGRGGGVWQSIMGRKMGVGQMRRRLQMVTGRLHGAVIHRVASRIVQLLTSIGLSVGIVHHAGR